MKPADALCAFAGLCLSFLASPLFAQDLETTADVQCLVAILVTGNQIDKVAPGSSRIAMMYFLGKIDGREPTLNLEGAIRRVFASMSRKDIGAADVRCGKLLSSRGHAMEAIGEHLILDPQGSGKGSASPSHAS